MTQKISSFLDAKYGWDYGESGWNTGMDENLLKFSFLFDKNIDGIVGSLPAVVNGTAYFLTTDKRIYFGVSGVWYSTPTPKWFVVTLRTTGVTYQFNGTDLISVPNNVDISSQLSAVQVVISTLGTAAFKNIDYFATTSQLSTASSQANTYTDSKVDTKANKGANSDITSLNGLTSPLSLSQGGTGANTASAARTSLGLGNSATLNTRAMPLEILSPTTDDEGHAFGYTTSSTATGNGTGYNHYFYRVSDDQVKQKAGVNGATGSKVNGMHVFHNFGGPNCYGGRHAMYGLLIQGYGGGGATADDNPDRNYVGVQGQVLTSTGDGGTSRATHRGAYFGISSFAGVVGDAAYVFNLTSCEFNTNIDPGTGPIAGNRVAMHTGVQVASTIGERGYDLDVCFSGSNLGGSPHGWKNGIAFHGLNGAPAFEGDSTVLKVFPSASAVSAIDTVIDVFGVATNILIKSNKMLMTETGINYNTSNPFINMGGSDANVPRQTFKSGGTASVYDTRISYSGGTATSGNGIMQIEAGGVITPLVRPSLDNTYTLGLSANRWSVVYAATGSINTSDADEKTNVEPLTEAEINAGKQLAKEIGTFRWLASVQAKGEDARLHIGMTVQRAIEIMKKNNLDPMAYGFICYDEWGATEAVVSENENGEVEILQPATEAGHRYGFRMDQLNLFIAAGLEARISALEQL